MNENDTAEIIEMAIILHLLIQLILLFLFIRMSCDLHVIRRKWVDQVRFENGKLEKLNN